MSCIYEWVSLVPVAFCRGALVIMILMMLVSLFIIELRLPSDTLIPDDSNSESSLLSRGHRLPYFRAIRGFDISTNKSTEMKLKVALLL